jgi:hypothetical protein
MKDSILKILLGIIAINLTIQTVTGGGFFPKSEAQSQSEMQAAISYCWDYAKLEKDGEGYKIRTYC